MCLELVEEASRADDACGRIVGTLEHWLICARWVRPALNVSTGSMLFGRASSVRQLPERKSVSLDIG